MNRINLDLFLENESINYLLGNIKAVGVSWLKQKRRTNGLGNSEISSVLEDPTRNKTRL